MLRHDCKPVIFLINNGGYTIERGYMGKTSDYNDIATWAYTELPKVFRPDMTARSFLVKTVADLEKALSARTRLRTPRAAAPRQRPARSKQLSQLVDTAAPHVRKRREGPCAYLLPLARQPRRNP